LRTKSRESSMVFFGVMDLGFVRRYGVPDAAAKACVFGLRPATIA
jgi:hypothetical protein